MENEQLVDRKQNYPAKVDWTVKTYPLGLVHGFQKDAIQNCVGARKTKNTWKNWKCRIDLVQTERGTFLTVEDSGTEGLTGPNLSCDEIGEKILRNEEFPIEWRLARMSCDNVSGGKSTGGGLFGVGKTLFAAASKTYSFLFESLTEEWGYRCNVNKNNQTLAKALEGDDAKNYIKSNTGLDPIEHFGTRIIVLDPNETIQKGISSGEMASAISETWWRIMPYFSEEEGIYLNGEKIGSPEEYKFEKNEKNSYYEDKPYNVETGYRVKKIGFFIKDELPENLRGFYYYRAGMKIGEIQLQDIPEAIKDKYFGFIEVDDEWESLLAAIESGTHYDTESPAKKNTAEYSTLKDHVRSVVKEKLIDWSYIKDKQSDDKELNDLLNDIKNDTENLFHDLGFDPMAHGDTKKNYLVMLKDVQFPDPLNRTVYDDETINFSWQIKSKYQVKKTFLVSLKTVCNINKKTVALFEREIEVAPGDSFEENYSLVVNNSNSEKFEANTLLLTVRPKTNTTNIAERKLTYYYSVETPERTPEDFELRMSSLEFPRESDKRVNTGESVKVKYAITSNIAKEVGVLLKIQTVKLGDRNEVIKQYPSINYSLLSCETKETEEFELNFDKETYEKVLKKGKIEVRARIVGNKDSGPYKGEILDEFKFLVYFNSPYKTGFEDSFEVLANKEPENKQRMWVDGHHGKWSIHMNIAHPDYLRKKDATERRYYFQELMIKAGLLIYLKEQNSVVIGYQENGYVNASHVDILEAFDKKADDVWYEKCQK